VTKLNSLNKENEMFKDNPYMKFKDLDSFFVGFDKVIDKMTFVANQAQAIAANYPPYNLKKIDDNKYVIEMAVAGFSKHDIEIELADDKLTIKGNSEADADFDPEGAEDVYAMIYQGLAMRPFTRTFTLADNVEIKGASMLNGILKVVMEAIIPEHKKPKKVEIEDEETSTPSTAEFLAERKGK
jgi:molecular chaperone IbpA